MRGKSHSRSGIPRSARKRKQRQALKERFPHWSRIARPELERRPALAWEENEAKKRVIQGDRGTASWSNFSSSLHEIEESLGVRISKIIERKIVSNNPKKPFKALDLGCGAGTALKELKSMFGEKIRTTGMVFERTAGEQYSGVDRLIVGDALKQRPHEQFNLIFSRRGAAYYTKMKLGMIQKVIGWLKPGGIAALHVESAIDKGLKQEIQTLLIQNGIKRFTIGSRVIVFSKPIRKLP